MREILVSQGAGKLSQSIQVGPHSLVADEPASNQGEDLGPNPMEYLCAALGSCTALTAKLYAQRKGWPLEETEVRVTLERQEDLTRFDRKVKFVGALDLSQKERLLEIINHCPVHKVLIGKIQIETELLP
jgi:putative redox protein